MVWDQVKEVLSQRKLSGVIVTGFTTFGTDSATFHPDFNTVYLDFDDCFLALRRQDPAEANSKIEVLLTDTLLYDFVQEGDDACRTSASIADFILPESWDYGLVSLKCFLNESTSQQAGTADYVILEIAHGSILSPERLGSSHIIVHSLCLHGIRLETYSQEATWQHLTANKNSRCVFEWMKAI